jgi:hypothetical protein
MMTARFLATLSVDLDAQPVDWSRSDRLASRPCEYVAGFLGPAWKDPPATYR